MHNQHGIDNIRIANFDGCGIYDTPTILPESIPECEWIGFNYANSCKAPQGKGIHFFLDDYQFLRIWQNPTKYIALLKKFDYVLSPDFSLYTDYPKAMLIYNHYRKHWTAAYWQSAGIKVIPTITWADKNSFDFCFEGEPTNAVVAVSSVGTQKNKRAQKLFLQGYNEMLERLMPQTILFFGNVPSGLQGNIVPVSAFQERFKR